MNEIPVYSLMKMIIPLSHVIPQRGLSLDKLHLNPDMLSYHFARFSIFGTTVTATSF